MNLLSSSASPTFSADAALAPPLLSAPSAARNERMTLAVRGSAVSADCKVKSFVSAQR